MAALLVRGSVVFRRAVPANDKKPAQVQMSVVDLFEGQRYGLWLDPKEVLALADRGDIVEFTGDLRIRDGYANLANVRDVQFYDVVPASEGK